ncbi:MAG: hypothetical protein IT236_19085, partial [Bacteroidia bacterium]|nr:hypothetical protein [Bacteroidia bacterium]
PTITGVGIATTSGTFPNYSVRVTSPTLTGLGTTTVTGSYPNYSINTAAQAQTSITSSGIGTITSAGTNSFDINVPQTNISGAGVTTVSGTFPNYTINTAAAAIPTITGTGIATTTSSGNSFTVSVLQPTFAYSQTTGSLTSGTASAYATPNLSLTGNVLTSGPASNSVTLPTIPTINAAGLATVSAGPNYTVGVAPLSYTSSTGVLGSGSNTLVVAPDLTFTNNILTSGPSTNSVDLSAVSPWTQTGGTVALTTSSSNVGIGTSNPNSRLQIDGTSTSSTAILRVNNTNTANTIGAIQVVSNGSSGMDVVGTNSAGAGLNVSSNGTGINASSTGLGHAIFAQNSNTATSALAGYFDGGIWTRGKTTNASAFSFFAQDVNSNTMFIIRNDGNVGVGTTNPVQKFDVVGNVGFSGALMPGNSAGTAGQYLVSAGSGSAPVWTSIGTGSNTLWSTIGNAGTTPSLNFIGTTDNVPLNFRVNNTKAGTIDPNLQNVFFGYFSGPNSTGANNAGYGYQSLASNLSGLENSAFGNSSMLSNTSGRYNTAVGSSALYSNLTGTNNVAVGRYALQGNTNGYDNTGLGQMALISNTSGKYNTAVGSNALFSMTTGTLNTALGYQAGYSALTSTGNVFVGANAGYYETGSNKLWIANSTTSTSPLIYGDFTNNFVGIGTASPDAPLQLANGVLNKKIVLNDAGAVNQHQFNGFGWDGNMRYQAAGTSDHVFWASTGASSSQELMRIKNNGRVGINNSTPSATLDVAGTFKLADGTEGAGKYLISDASGNASWNAINSGTSAIWSTLGNAGTTSSVNFIGTTDAKILNFRVNNVQAGSISYTNNSVFFGQQAGQNSSLASFNTAIGQEAMSSNVTAGGVNNTAVGYRALRNVTSGQDNNAFGYGALINNTTGFGNVAIGNSAMSSRISGANNIAIGNSALVSNTNGSDNAVVGYQAFVSSASGGSNVALGSLAGFNNTAGNGNVFLGHNAGFYETGSNKLYVSNSSTSVTPLIYGDFATKRLGIGNVNPGTALEVTGDISIPYTNKIQFGTISSGLGTGEWIQNASFGLGFYTSSTERIKITNLGRVGINNATPTATLDVLGTFKLKDGTEGAGKYLISDASGNASWNAVNSGTSALWSTLGNAGTTSSVNFIGTTDNVSLYFRANNSNAGSIRLASNSTYWGSNAGPSTDIGSWNVGIGHSALSSAISLASENAAVGSWALRNLTSGTRNAALGSEALDANSSGSKNIGIGYRSGYSNINGSNNVFIGNEAGFYETGSNKLWIANNTTSTTPLIYGDFANNFVGIGTASPNALLQLANGNANRKLVLHDATNTDHQFYGFGMNSSTLRMQIATTAAIYQFNAGTSATTSSELMRLTGLGRLGLNNASPTATLDVAGTFKLKDGTEGANKVLVSDASGNASWSAVNSGTAALWSTLGNAATNSVTNFIGTSDNVSLMFRVNNIRSGAIDHNRANAYFGFESGLSSSTASLNAAFGQEALRNMSTGTNRNSAFGYQALRNNTSGGSNTGIGASALTSNLGGADNTAVGKDALYTNQSGVNNVAVGSGALLFNVSGVDNVGVGKDVLNKTNSNYNVALGNFAGFNNVTGSSNVFIGYAAGYNETGRNKLWIANSTTSTSPLIYGDFSTGHIGIGTSTANGELQFNQAANSRKIVFWEGGNNGHQFYGFGVNTNTLRYQVDASVANHVFYSGINSVASKELMRIQGDGRIGIGVAAPSTTFAIGNGTTEKFNINGATGDMNFLDDQASITFPVPTTAAQPMIYMFPSGANNNDRMVLSHSPTYTNYGLQYQDASDKFNFLSNGTPVLTADLNNARVGIGTSTPSTALQVNGDISLPYTNKIQLGISGSGQGNGEFIQNTFGGGSYGIGFYSTTEKMRIDGATGNVGIGTSTPHAPLQLGNSAVNRKIVLYETANNDNQFYGLGVNASSLRYQVDQTASNHIWYAGTGTATSDELFRVQGNGRVGINQTAPTATFEVNGTTKLADGTQGIDKVLRSDAAGNASWVNSSINSGFSVYGSVSQTFTVNANNVVFGSELYDDGADFASNTFTAPVAGVYHFDAAIRVNSGIFANPYMYIAIYVNGSLAKNNTGFTSNSSDATVNVSADLKLTAGQLVTIQFYGGSAAMSTQPGVSSVFFTGHRVY